MFTGLVETIGRVVEIKLKENLIQLSIAALSVFKGSKIGDSIAVNGVCLTVVKLTAPDVLSFEMIQESIERSALKFLSKNDTVNLERALKMSDRFGGHFVTGHVDCVGTIIKILKKDHQASFVIRLPKSLMRFIVMKGSIAIEGVSLTIGKVYRDGFEVYLIPHTLQATTLGRKKIAEAVNIETDLLAKYVVNTPISAGKGRRFS